MTTQIMLTASQARAKAKNDLVIFNEIRNIELAILEAIVDGGYQIDISTTSMTNTDSGNINTARRYFNAWQGIVSDRSFDVQMSTVIAYFTDLGYSIERRTNPSTGDTFIWLVMW